MQVNYLTLTIGLLGAVKLILNAYGVDIISDTEINAIANGVAAIATIVGVWLSHQKTN